MKKILAFSIIVAIALVSCKSAPKADKAKTEEGKEVAAAEGVPYKIDANQLINFIGTKPVGEHHGTFDITDGTLYVKDDINLTGGKFTFDMASLKITDKDSSGTTKLKGHLSSPDFLDVAKFPTASFEVTSVEPYTPDSTNALVLDGATNTIKGNLTLKGVTKNVSFPAVVTVSPTTVTAKANFNINRTEWGLVYANDQSLGDKFIRPEVNVSFAITATK